ERFADTACAPSSRAASSRGSGRRATSVSSKPSARSARAIASPIPDDPPVTSADFTGRSIAEGKRVQRTKTASGEIHPLLLSPDDAAAAPSAAALRERRAAGAWIEGRRAIHSPVGQERSIIGRAKEGGRRGETSVPPASAYSVRSGDRRADVARTGRRVCSEVRGRPARDPP